MKTEGEVQKEEDIEGNPFITRFKTPKDDRPSILTAKY